MAPLIRALHDWTLLRVITLIPVAAHLLCIGLITADRAAPYLDPRHPIVFAWIDTPVYGIIHACAALGLAVALMRDNPGWLALCCWASAGALTAYGALLLGWGLDVDAPVSLLGASLCFPLAILSGVCARFWADNEAPARR